MSHVKRRYPIGAEPIGPGRTHFRVWAPKAQLVDLVLEETAGKNPQQTFHALETEEGGYFSGHANARAGTRYWFRVKKNFSPDPPSLFHPAGLTVLRAL